jgi:hypothetical protein
LYHEFSHLQGVFQHPARGWYCVLVKNRAASSGYEP